MSELEELKADPRFQNLLGKAETHEWEFRPKEAARLKAEGRLEEVLLLRTRECWDSLKACRQSGMTQWEAEEVALPLILLPDEAEDPKGEEMAGTEDKSGIEELNLVLGEPEGPEPNAEEWIQQGMERLKHCDGKALF